MKYEKLEVEPFHSKQKLRMFQNAVGDVSELAYVKQIGDQDIACGNPPLLYESYMELLLSAFLTYDKKTTLPGKQKRAVYASEIASDGIDYSGSDPPDGEYEVFRVDTDISDIMAYATDTNRFGNNRNGSKPMSSFLPKDEWDKMIREQKN